MILYNGISQGEDLYKRLPGKHFRKRIQKSAISKKRNTGRFLNNLLAWSEQKKKTEAMRIMKQKLTGI